MLQSISENNKYVSFGISAAKNIGKVTATATIIIPMALGARELYRGYIPNNIRSLPRNDETSTIKKIIRCISPILAFKLGCDLMWSKYSYRKISDRSFDSIRKVDLKTISNDKLKLFFSRKDSGKVLEYFDLKTLLANTSSDRKRVIFNGMSDEKFIQCIRDFMKEPNLHEIVGKLCSLVNEDKLSKAFVGLSDSEKDTFITIIEKLILEQNNKSNPNVNGYELKPQTVSFTELASNSLPKVNMDAFVKSLKGKSLSQFTDDQIMYLYMNIKDKTVLKGKVVSSINAPRKHNLLGKLLKFDDLNREKDLNQSATVLGINNPYGEWKPIKNHWRQLNRAHHPDKNPNGSDEMQKINASFDKIKEFREAAGLSIN
jgi:hypothetical protein